MIFPDFLLQALAAVFAQVSLVSGSVSLELAPPLSLSMALILLLTFCFLAVLSSPCFSLWVLLSLSRCV